MSLPYWCAFPRKTVLAILLIISVASAAADPKPAIPEPAESTDTDGFEPVVDAVILTLSTKISVKVYPAFTPEQWRQQMKHVETGPTVYGRLLVFPREGIHPVYVSGLHTEPDLIFINRNSVIARVVSGIPAGSRVAAGIPVLAVLEAPDGFCADSGIKPGHLFGMEGLDLSQKENPRPRAEEIAEALDIIATNPEYLRRNACVMEMAAQFYLDIREWEKADAAFRLCLERGKTALRLTGLASALVRMNRIEEAETLYREAMDLDPSDLAAYKGILQLIALKNDASAAKKFIQQAIIDHPDQYLMRLDQVRLTLDSGELSAAEEMIKIAADRFPENPDIARVQGDLHLRKGEYAQAADCYIQYLKSCPYDAHAADLRAFITVHRIRKAQLQK